MKKLILPLLLIAFLNNSFAQYTCIGAEDVADFRSNCTRVTPTDIYDTGLLALSYIPDNSTPVVTIPVRNRTESKKTYFRQIK